MNKTKKQDGIGNSGTTIVNRLRLLVASGLLLTTTAGALADEYPLYAGKTTLVGNVEVSNLGNLVTVIYTITEPGWVMTESHLQVGAKMSDFPLSSGNPSPGKFAFSASYVPGVTTCEYGPIDITGLSSPLMIAAHAKVYHTDPAGDGNLAVNGSFEDGVYEGDQAEGGWAYLTGGTGIGDISDWSLLGTAQWFDHTLYPWFLPSDGERFVNFKAIGVPASLSQDVPTVAGETYEVGFDLCSNQYVPGMKGLIVSADADSEYFTSADDFNNWTRQTFLFKATDAATTLEFLSADDVEWWGVCIDNVTVKAANYESIWGGTVAFPGNSWATYFEYTLIP